MDEERNNLINSLKGQPKTNTKKEKADTALFLKNIPKVGWDGIFRKFKEDKQLITKLGVRKIRRVVNVKF